MYTVLILAAGEGKRLRKNGLKPLLDFHAKPFLTYVLLKFLGIEDIDEHIVVIGHEAKRVSKVVPEGYMAVTNKNYREGMTSSLKCGLKYIRHKNNHIIFMPFDYPMLSRKTIIKLILTHKKNPGKIVLPSYKKRKGHPVIFDRCYMEKLLKVNPGKGARQIIYENAGDVVYCVTRSRGVLVDIDTTEDYLIRRFVPGREKGVRK